MDEENQKDVDLRQRRCRKEGAEYVTFQKQISALRYDGVAERVCHGQKIAPKQMMSSLVAELELPYASCGEAIPL